MLAYRNWVGASGQAYSFAHRAIGDIQPAAGGVYIVCRPNASLANVLAGRGDYEALYVGKAQSLDDRVNTGLHDHHKWSEFERLGATHIGTHVVSREAERSRIELDLIQGLRPVLNEVGLVNALAGLRFR